MERKNNFAGVVVWLKPLNAPVSLRLPRRRAQILQKDKTFKPHILAVSVGTNVDFPNSDPIFHNAFSNFNGQIFDIGLYAPGSSRSIRFERPGIVRVFCNIHAAMSAIIVVVDSPYYTITDSSGTFSFSNVSPGEYTLHFFHERATPETLDRLVRSISIDGAAVQAGTAVISETGYLPVAHKNKYGSDYSSSDAQRTYTNPIK